MRVVFYLLCFSIFIFSELKTEVSKVKESIISKYQYIETKVGRIAYLDTKSQGPALVCIHGNSCSSKVFQKQVDRFRNDYRLICIDLPGHGLSANLESKDIYTIPNYARVIDEVVKQLEIDKFIVIGFSLGGNIALQLTQINSDILSVIMISSAPCHYSERALEAYPPHRENFSARAKQLSEDQAKRFMGGCGFRVEESSCYFMVEDAKRADGRSRVEMVHSVLNGDGKDEVDIISNLRVPLVVIAGEDDPVLGIEYIQNLKYKNLWNDRINIIPHGSHAILFHHEEEVNNLIENFIKSLVIQ
ncbi:MAG: AB hydrolase superfamily protein YdjP [Chlamydiia bacterium]|nr:AB hydrolase superfamily protein YdjP [Chlamydiia bacterium]